MDVRRYPGSRRHPHFGRDALSVLLSEHGLAYDWRGDALGGRRRASGAPTRHPALTNVAFRNFADYMDTHVFGDALARLEDDARAEAVAIMCAETLWWRCHRRLIADALVLRRVDVVHLLGKGKRHVHQLHAAARADERERPVYDVAPAAQG